MSKKYHFIAIGGVGMSGLAKYLLQNGYEVSGSDISDSKYIAQLRDLGGIIHIGHSESNVPENSVVVISSAIRETNPELKIARKRGQTVFHRSDLLAEISRSDKCFIGFSGTHGKTTTSGMASYVMSKAGLNPSYVVGGIIPEYSTNAEYSQGKHFIAELDESDGTIIKYLPNILIVNNLEADHLDHYKNGLEDVLYTFGELFISKLNNSKLILNNDDKGVNLLIDKYIHSDYITYGLNKADYVTKNIEYKHGYTTFNVYYKETFLASVKIILPGKHNVYNTLAVISALHQAGVDISQAASYFETFTGMGRRFQKVAELDGITVYDDYAHHPTEIKSTLSAMKSFTDNEIVAVFQPHRYTRLQSLWNEFKTALNDADRIIVTDVYAASEDEIEGINSEKFVSELSDAEYISGTISDVANKLLPTLKENTVVIGLGAGTITNLGKELKNAKGNFVCK